MTKIILAALIGGLAANAHAIELKSLDAIKMHANRGEYISTILEMQKCSLNAPMNAYHHPLTIAIAKDHIAFSDNHLTTNHPGYPGRAVLENVTYRISENNDYSMTIRVLDPQSYERIDNGDMKITCKLGDSAHVYVP